MTITIIIPVFNQAALVRRCVASVVRNTLASVPIVVCDDASTEKQVERVYAEFADRIQVRRSETNRGFVRTVNDALAKVPQGAVVVLNSDAEVPCDWLFRLEADLACLLARDVRVAAICPVSDNATIFSMPSFALNAGATVDDLNAVAMGLRARGSLRETPVVHGFCMLLTRDALDAVGGFDEAFAPAYGEEVDWCLRARALGFQCFVDAGLFVRHENHASYGGARTELVRRAVELIDARYPHYRLDVADWAAADPLLFFRVAFARAQRRREIGGSPRPLVVHVTHSFGRVGGVEHVVRSAIEARPGHDHVVLVPLDVPEATFAEVDGALVIAMPARLLRAKVRVGGLPLQSRATGVRLWFDALMNNLRPDQVIFHHVAKWGDPAVVDIALRYCAHVTVELHDVFIACPVLQRGGGCDCEIEDSPACVACVKAHATYTEPVTDEQVVRECGNWVAAYRTVLLRDGVTVVVPSEALARMLGLLRYTVVRPEVKPAVVRFTRRHSDCTRIAFVGHATKAKGWEAFAAVARACRASDVMSFSVIGPVDSDLSLEDLEHVTFSGMYDSADLAGILQHVDIAIPAVQRNEAYGVVVDECLAAGCDVILPDVPALRERFSCHDTRQLWFGWGDATDLLYCIDRACGL